MVGSPVVTFERGNQTTQMSLLLDRLDNPNYLELDWSNQTGQISQAFWLNTGQTV